MANTFTKILSDGTTGTVTSSLPTPPITAPEARLLVEQELARQAAAKQAASAPAPSMNQDLKDSSGKYDFGTTAQTSDKDMKKNISSADRDIKKFLDKIWNIYGIHDGEYLSALTHEKGTPWDEVYCKGCNSILSDESILKHYTSKLKPA
jgi:hypothetical protein